MGFWQRLFGRKAAPATVRRFRHRFIPSLEVIERRECPAGTWNWDGPRVGAGGDGLWSNPTGIDWQQNGVQAAAGKYPGMAGSLNDNVTFNTLAAGPATKDVLTNNLQSLSISNWSDTLTLNKPLTVSGGSAASFLLSMGSTISIADNMSLNLLDVGAAQWTRGIITGATNNTNFNVTGTSLTITGGASQLGTNLVIQKSANTGNSGAVSLYGMNGNLLLSGTSNIIEAANGGTLQLNQQIVTNGTQNTLGGIDLGVGHTGTLAVQVDSGGSLIRGSIPMPGVANQVSIAGAVYNLGGTVEIDPNDLLKITGKDASGFSYWQKSGSSALLQLDDSANINAAGTYQIDIGTLKLTAPSGPGAPDELDGAGLTFGNTNPTALTFVDAMGSGTVKVQGPVTLAANTTTTMNFNGMANASDQLSVSGGALTVAGKLSLKGGTSGKPTKPLNFFADSGAAPTINGTFTSISDDQRGTDAWSVIAGPPGGTAYGQVTIS